MVESNDNISETQAEILQGFSNFLTVSDIARHRKTSRQAVYKGISRLIEKGLIKKVGMAWGLTQKGKQGLHSLMGLTSKLRQHNIGVKIEVLESKRNWDKKRNIIMQMPYFNKRIKLKNNTYDLLRFGKVGIKSTTKSIIFNLPTIFDSSVDGAIIQAMDILFSTIPKVENRFKVRLMKDNKMNMKLISQEYARLNDALARLYKAEGNKLYFSGEDGKVWLIADYSFAVNELETIHPDKAGDDMETVHSFMNDLRAKPVVLSDVIQTMHGIQQNQLVFDRNMKSHIKAVQQLGDGVKELIKVVKEIKK